MNLHQTITILSLKLIALITILSLLSLGCRTTAEIYVYKQATKSSDFPESRLKLDSTGVCFSGGGSHAMTMAIGQMRALRTLGLWKDIGYISAVSGGSWASTIFTFYNEGAANDDELLGYMIEPEHITLDTLNFMPNGFMGQVVTNNLLDDLFERLGEEIITWGILQKSDKIWIDAIGHTYLKKYGLYDPGHEQYFTLNDSTRSEIIRRNPKLKSSDFVLVHERRGDSKRPFLVVNSSVIAPADDLPLKDPEQLSVFNYTPLYVGSNQPNYVIDTNIISGNAVKFNVGGGFIEPFGFGSDAPKKTDLKYNSEGYAKAKVKLPKRKFEVVDATGTSSSAFGAVASSSFWLQIPTEILLGFTADQIIPEEKYWPLTKNGSIASPQNYRFSDGGNLENFGLISLMQRGVKKMVVFVNSSSPIGLDAQLCDSLPPSANDLDSDIFPLFGYSVGNQTQNQVFPQQYFDTLYNELLNQKKLGKTVMARTKLPVVPNKWWGIKGGGTVDILWVYNEKVPEWECQLPPKVKREIAKGSKGIFANFPDYQLMFENGPTELVELTTPQVNLLYQLSAWNVHSNKNMFYNLIRGD